MKSERLLFEHFQAMVAPARERGLKFSDDITFVSSNPGRSRKGAWIEITFVLAGSNCSESLPQGSVD